MPPKKSPLVFKADKDKVLISGKTFDIKERLKAVGGTWISEKNTWQIPASADTPSFREGLEIFLTDKKEADRRAVIQAKAYAASPEGIASAHKAQKVLIKKILIDKKPQFHWICCEDCEVIDWSRKHTSCNSCGIGGNTFFKEGRLYTGD